MSVAQSNSKYCRVTCFSQIEAREITLPKITDDLDPGHPKLNRRSIIQLSLVADNIHNFWRRFYADVCELITSERYGYANVSRSLLSSPSRVLKGELSCI